MISIQFQRSLSENTSSSNGSTKDVFLDRHIQLDDKQEKLYKKSKGIEKTWNTQKHSLERNKEGKKIGRRTINKYISTQQQQQQQQHEEPLNTSQTLFKQIKSPQPCLCCFSSKNSLQFCL